MAQRKSDAVHLATRVLSPRSLGNDCGGWRGSRRVVGRTHLLLASHTMIAGSEPARLHSDSSLESHCEVLNELPGLSLPVPSSHKQDNEKTRTRLGTQVPRAQLFLLPLLALGRRHRSLRLGSPCAGRWARQGAPRGRGAPRARIQGGRLQIQSKTATQVSYGGSPKSRARDQNLYGGSLFGSVVSGSRMAAQGSEMGKRRKVDTRTYDCIGCLTPSEPLRASMKCISEPPARAETGLYFTYSLARNSYWGRVTPQHSLPSPAGSSLCEWVPGTVEPEIRDAQGRGPGIPFEGQGETRSGCTRAELLTACWAPGPSQLWLQSERRLRGFRRRAEEG